MPPRRRSCPPGDGGHDLSRGVQVHPERDTRYVDTNDVPALLATAAVDAEIPTDTCFTQTNFLPFYPVVLRTLSYPV